MEQVTSWRISTATMRATFLRLAASSSRKVTSAVIPSRPSPPPGAAKLVRDLLNQHGPLSSQNIFRLGTEGCQRVSQPTALLDEKSNPLMKRAPNVRGGKSPIVPGPIAPLPDHPFLSMSHLKRKVLTALEDRSLIYRARQLVPHRNEDARRAATELAAKMTLRMQRKALELKEPPPPPVEARSLSAEYVWKLGPAPGANVPPASGTASWESMEAAELLPESNPYELDQAAERRAAMQPGSTGLRQSRNEGKVHRRESRTDGKKLAFGLSAFGDPKDQFKTDQRLSSWPFKVKSDKRQQSDSERPRASEHDGFQARPRRPSHSDRTSKRHERR